MKIDKKVFDSPHGAITLYTLTNNAGASVTLSSMGAGIVAVVVPDSCGRMDDVALGYGNPCDYFNDGPCAGKTPGRYANRIALGKFEINGKQHQLAINNGPNALHGGPMGFNNHIWNCDIEGEAVVFTLHSPHNDEHYPGNLDAMVRYEWSHDNELTISLSAVCDAATIVNLTNHAYFNLAGENAGSVLDHTLQLACSRYLPTNDSLIPTGEMAPVQGTPMDFTSPKALGQDIKQDFSALNYGKGYDNCWVVDDYHGGELKKVAVLAHARSGRVLEVSTTQPAAQVYTGNWLAGSPVSKSGRSYNDYDGVAIECQGMPDAPNHPNFPSQLLEPGQTYHHTIVYAFKTK